MKKIFKLLVAVFACFIVFAFYVKEKNDSSEYIAVNSPSHFSGKLSLNPLDIKFASTVPTDPANGYTSSPQEMATFAWQEFVALNWPAATNSNPNSSGYKRGMPSTQKLGATGSSGTVVWETFAHRVELYPGRKSFLDTIPQLPDIEDARVHYEYGLSAMVAAAPGIDTTLFNNLDEASEITLADMYYTPLAKANTTEASLLYEAKGNNILYNYVQKHQFQNSLTRGNAAANTVNKITNKPYNTPTFELPNGSVEVKATWRRYDSTVDNLADFHYATAIWYSGKTNGVMMIHNDIFLLIGLHIIQKTPSFQTFTFATFEHVSNEKNGFQFVNTHAGIDTATIPGRAIPEPGVVKAIRQYPIPNGSNGSFDLVSFNKQIQSQLKTQFGSDIVWANYELIGIQGEVTNNPTASVPAQTFFLSNFATETNNTLQFFQGTLTGTFSNIVNPNAGKVHKLNSTTSQYETFTAGGCLGCHGSQGQSGGYDFSVISANGNSFAPEPPEDYPGGTIVNQDPTGYPLPQTPQN